MAKIAQSAALSALLLLPALGAAALAAGPTMIIQADMVRGVQKGMTAPPCVLSSQFHHGELVAWRIRVIDAKTGKQLDDKALKSVVVSFPNGSADGHWGGHPPPKPVDMFWSASWMVPADYPTGSLNYTVTAIDKKGRTARFEPFKTPPSLLTIVADAGTK